MMPRLARSPIYCRLTPPIQRANSLAFTVSAVIVMKPRQIVVVIDATPAVPAVFDRSRENSRLLAYVLGRCLSANKQHMGITDSGSSRF